MGAIVIFYYDDDGDTIELLAIPYKDMQEAIKFVESKKDEIADYYKNDFEVVCKIEVC